MFDQINYIFNPEELIRLQEYYSIEIGATAIFFTLIKYEKASDQPSVRKFVQNLGKDLGKLPTHAKAMGWALNLNEILVNIDLTLKLQKIALPINLYISKEVQSVRILLNTPAHREPINTFWFGKCKLPTHAKAMGWALNLNEREQ